jgi:lipopolysaccharide export system protein LptC
VTVSYFFEQYRIYIVLFFLLLGSWLLASFFEQKEGKAFQSMDHTPDYFSKDYYKKEMDHQGLAINELTAEKLTHYSDDGTTHLEKPVMTLYSAKSPSWIIKSTTGLLAADRDNLLLSGKVFINRQGTKRQKSFDINTSELRVKLSTNYAETDEWAEIIEGSSRTEGIGMNTTFVEPIWIKFLSKVKGQYEFN